MDFVKVSWVFILSFCFLEISGDSIERAWAQVPFLDWHFFLNGLLSPRSAFPQWFRLPKLSSPGSPQCPPLLGACCGMSATNLPAGHPFSGWESASFLLLWALVQSAFGVTISMLLCRSALLHVHISLMYLSRNPYVSSPPFLPTKEFSFSSLSWLSVTPSD